MAAILEGLIKRSRPHPRPETNAAKIPEPVTKRRCLLIDDSRVIRKVARRILEGLAYEVSEAENGEEALVKCRSAMPDLIIVDWNMPVMSGLEFVTFLRSMQGERRPKVMFCTTNSNTDDIRKGIEAGADEYVIKPFDQQSLQAKLQRIGAA
ncbi:response regulator [Novosphingobium mathurense]|uniref:Two-component system, chemotaxis family, response regulator CheY n=1 Tax=Novosphingobium mathurense TaxID=428990 RepID=A0A1U6I7T6_9SPHN|nr:response regulator [Novosphingobium mathurense]SLK04074.1 two-component system, chemotaxis family, response regulator CheY [Novosphingobium mathurense]